MRISVPSRESLHSFVMRAISFYYFTIFFTIVMARCPDSKKAHPTSCTIFYNCVQLPDGGYVWVPSKCAQGLVFQPYLRLCVLPGDLWTCGSSTTEASLVASTHGNAQFRKREESDYLRSTEDSSEFSELMDHPFATDGISESPNSETVTSYPLEEIENATEVEYDKKDPEKNSLCNHSDIDQNVAGAHTLLNKLINHLLVYKEITIPLESITTSVDPNLADKTMPTDLLKNTRYNVLANYLIQNYIQQNNLQTTVIASVNPESTTGVESMAVENTNDTTNSEHVSIIITAADGESNIVLIKDSAGNKQYLTIEDYKSHPQYSKYATLVPCVRNIRLPNATDCTKYYTCDPSTAIVTEYSCPQNSAFNKYSRICDTDSQSSCTETSTLNVIQSEESGKPTFQKICTELGKMKDPFSDFHYFVCYASSTESKPIRLACPNGLIFCQSKKFCTTKRLCAS